MPSYRTTLGQESYRFDGLALLMAVATPERSGDQLAGIAVESAAYRVAARYALADLPLQEFLSETVVSYEADEVTRLIQDSHDAASFAPGAAISRGLPVCAA